MENTKKTSLMLGILVAVGLVLFTMAIYFLGSKTNLFSSSVTIKSHFNNVSGLIEGNKVRYAGITIGSVSDISIVSDSNILVEMTVDEEVKKFIRKNSKVEISSDGLMGSKIINILPGTVKAGSISDDDHLVSIDPLDIQDVLEEAKRVVEDGRKVTRNLVDISEKINTGDGDLALLLNEQNISTHLNRIGDNINGVVDKADNIVAKIENGEGDIGRLINDTIISSDMAEVMKNMKRISYNADSISNQLLQFSKELNDGNGLVQRVVYDEKMADNIDTAIIKISYGIEDVVEAAETIEKSWIFNLFSKNKKE